MKDIESISALSRQEQERLEALFRYHILDTPTDESFDRITLLLQQLLDVPIALISLVDEKRQWFKSHIGLDATETPRNISFCTHAIQKNDVFHVPDASIDERFRDNPLVTNDPNIRFYAGVPLKTWDNHNLGTLCVIDVKPRSISALDVNILQTLGQLVIDQMESKLAAASIKKSEQRFRALFEQAGVGVSMTNAETGRFIEVNKKYQEIVGYSLEELRELNLVSITHQDDLEHQLKLTQGLLAGEYSEYSIEKRYIKKDSSIVWVSITCTALWKANEKPTHHIAVVEDITERKEQSRQINNSLEEKETLLKEVYHRVKNNLQVIQSLLNIKGRTLPDGEARIAISETAQRIRAMALVHEKLYQSTDLSAINLADYVDDLLRQLLETWGGLARGIHITQEIEAARIGLDTAIPLGLIINELVSNTLKHAFPDGRGGNVNIHFNCDEYGNGTLTVNDNGIGMPADLELSRDHSIGLKLATNLSSQVGGILNISSTPGKGTTLRVDFPQFTTPQS